MEERHETTIVQDRPTEDGIKLNNILTFMILAVMTWVGANITVMKDSLAEVQLEGAVRKSEIIFINEKVDRHIENDRLINGAK